MVQDTLGLLSASENKSLWRRFADGYTTWVMLIGMTGFLLFAYFAADAMQPLVFLLGIPLLGHFKSFRKYWLPAVLTGALLFMGFLRSDFVTMMVHGKSIGEAYVASTRYFQAPIIMWFAGWAVIFAASDLSEVRALKVFKWFSWLMIGLSAMELLETVSGMGMRNAINTTYFHGHRPEMVIVTVSNTNTALLMMFWPLTLFFLHKRQYVFIAAMTLGIVGVSIVADTNAQLLGLLASFVVFLVARHWPRALSLKGVTPERVLGGLTAFAVLAFPAIIYYLIKSGLDHKLKTTLPPSWAARIDIWTYAVKRCMEKPIWGWGYEASRNFEPYIPNHPHNPSLQAWLELGLPGLVLLAVFWLSILWLMGSPDDFSPVVEIEKPVNEAGLRALDASADPGPASFSQYVRPYLLASVATYFIINLVSYGLWRAWFYHLGGMMMVAMILSMKAVKADIKLRN